MPHSYIAAAQTAKYIAISGAGTAASAMSLSVQLNQPHEFMHLYLPLWFFYVGMVLLAFAGAFLSLATDTLKNKGSMIGKVLSATTVGLIVSFILLPALSAQPSPVIMLVTAVGGGFSGTVLLYLAARLINNQALQDGVIDIMSTRIVTVLDLVTGRLVEFISRLLGGGNK